jgi:proteasome lid subunit RPN8/RPN11
MFDIAVIEAIRNYAVAQYPKEACGFVINPEKPEFFPCENIHPNPETSFQIEDEWWVRLGDENILAVIHSHPNGPDYPSGNDMRHQRTTGVPWGICTVQNGVATKPFFFGDEIEIPPLIGREFRHGVTDCYAFIRDYYRVERGVVIPNYPRDYEWWYNGQDLYSANFREAGFEPVSEPEIGDVFLAQLHAPVVNHGGIYMGNGVIGHHLVGRLSRREPAYPWRRFLTTWLRYTKG